MIKSILKVLIISLFIILIFAIKSYGTSDFSYTLDVNGNAIITAYNGTESNLTIPSKIDGHMVNQIASHAFDGDRDTHNQILEKITISEGISDIGDFAFVGCTNLESIQLPESLMYLGDTTFIRCSKLKQINIPSKIATFGYSGYMFQETGFTEFIIPENVKNIPNATFRLCQNLKKVTVYSNDVVYGSEVFEYCSEDLILYANEGSTTQAYAQQNGIQFKKLSDSEEEPPTTTMGSIHLNKNELLLKENESEILTVSFIDLPTTEVIWSSSNENVAIVENGKVIAKNIGDVTITVKTENGIYKDTCVVSVIKKENSSEPTIIPMTSIYLNKSDLNLCVGNTETLLTTIIPNNTTDKNLVWSSSNPSVVTVENGKIVGKSVGFAIITVSNLDGTIKDICNVTVTNKKLDEDNTIVEGELPQTGIDNMISIILFLIYIAIIFTYKHYKGLNDL